MKIDLNEEIRMLTIRNPYAELVLHGKEIETRSRVTNYRGLVLIHTGLVDYTWDEVDDMAGRNTLLRILDMFATGELTGGNTGHVIAIARLVDCRPMNKADEAKAFVTHNHSLYAWVLEDITPVIPFKMRGTQGMNQIIYEHKKLIKF